MIRSSAVLLATCLLAIGAPSAAAAQSQEPERGTPRPAAAATEDEPRQICRMEKQIGSQRSTRVCRSPDQIQKDRENAADSMRSRGSKPSRKSG